MKPMTTITYDPAVYKLVPVEPTREMVWACKDKFIPRIALPFFVAGYKTMLAAVPDQLPGVVVHSGDPVVFMNNSPLGDANWLDAAHVSSTAPSQPSAEAIVQAALEAAANECNRMMMFPGGRQESYAHHGVDAAAAAIRALSAQQIIESCKEKS